MAGSEEPPMQETTMLTLSRYVALILIGTVTRKLACVWKFQFGLTDPCVVKNSCGATVVKRMVFVSMESVGGVHEPCVSVSERE